MQAVFGTIQLNRLNDMLKKRRKIGLSRNNFFKDFQIFCLYQLILNILEIFLFISINFEKKI